jgi:hypothetical protein
MRIFVDDERGTVSVEWHARAPLSVLRDDGTVTVQYYVPVAKAPVWDSDGGDTEDYERGHDEGRAEGFDDGYDRGHEEGHVEGYDKGLTDGRAEAKSPEAVA